jgi:aerobic-type carbon monoxide dehydrogenase small subunit (CoxS/CutS family)
MALSHALEKDPRVDEARLRTLLSSNICRCTGYTKILLAAADAAEQMLAAREERAK